MDKIISKNNKDTEKLAIKILEEINLEKPIVFLLKGELGGGKTVFVKAIAKALGVKETVTSPTFILYNSYTIKSQDPNSPDGQSRRDSVILRKKSKQISRSKFSRRTKSSGLRYTPQEIQTKDVLVHWDLYRIEEEKELETIGFWEIIKEANMVCIEWPERMGKKYLEKIKKEMKVIEINFEYGKKLNERVIRIDR